MILISLAFHMAENDGDQDLHDSWGKALPQSNSETWDILASTARSRMCNKSNFEAKFGDKNAITLQFRTENISKLFMDFHLV